MVMWKKLMVKCLKCGENHPRGSYHFIHCGIMFNNDRKNYGWNCMITDAPSIYRIEEKILDNYLSNSKAPNILVYE